MARILVIDDDELVRFALRRVLTSAGHHIVEAADGRDGLMICRDTPVDLVITDIVMPDKDGIETITALRRFDRKVQIIAISGGGFMGRGSYLRMAERLGANRVLNKPFENVDLIEAVHSCTVSS